MLAAVQPEMRTSLQVALGSQNTNTSIVGPTANYLEVRRFALPMGILYAAYVVVNLITFRLWGPVEPGVGYAIFGLVYAAVAIGVSSGAAWALARRRTELV